MEIGSETERRMKEGNIKLWNRAKEEKEEGKETKNIFHFASFRANHFLPTESYRRMKHKAQEQKK